MKASLLFVMAASMIIGTALNAQTNPYPNDPARPHNRLPLPPPPSATRRTITPPVQQRFNLGGTWQFSANGKIINIQFEQQADQLKSFYGVGNLGRTEALLFEGRYTGGVIVGQRITLTNARVADTLTVDDPDHVRAGNGLMMIRISPARADDAICDLQNSSHTQAGFAYDRALDAAHRNLPSSLNACWLQVSANQGHARAEAVTAMAFRDGEGVPRNYATAFSWAQKSAEQGDAVGEAVLGQLYNSGFGTPRNPQLSQYWQSKAQAQLSVLQARQRQPQPQPQQSQPSPLDVFVAFCKLTGCDQLPHATSQSDEQKRQAEKDAAVNADECLAAKGYWHPNYGEDYYGSGRCW
jgi:hypothetical protein